MAYFKSRWGGDASTVGVHNLVLDLINDVISEEDNTVFCRPITIQEVETVLQLIDVSESSGPDGFLSYFYKYY